MASGATSAESATTLDLRFPVTGATDYVAYSIDGTTEWANLARTFIGATGWQAATVADPSVKANSATLTSAAVVTAGGTITHFAIFTAATGGTQRTDWQALDNARALAIGDTVQWSVASLNVTLT